MLDDRPARRAAKTAEEIVELIETRAREAYARREIEYPVDHMLTFAFGGAEDGQHREPVRGRLRARRGRGRSTASSCRWSTSAACRVPQAARRADRLPGAVARRRQARGGGRQLIAGNRRAAAKRSRRRSNERLRRRGSTRRRPATTTPAGRSTTARRTTTTATRASTPRDIAARPGAAVPAAGADRPGAVRPDPDLRPELEGPPLRDGHAQERHRPAGVRREATRASSTRRKATATSRR